MKSNQIERLYGRALEPSRWLRTFAVLLLLALLVGPATGLGAALHHHFAHDHSNTPLSSDHDCDICLASHASFIASPQAAAVIEPGLLGLVLEKPSVSTDWLFVSPTTPRGPPAC